MIFLTETKCKIHFILQKKKRGVKNVWNLCLSEGRGGVRPLMERSFLNFHFDYWNPSLIRFQFYGDFNFLNAINECIQHSIVPHQVDFDCTTSRFGRVIKTLWSFLPLKKSQQCHRTFIIYSNYNFNWLTPGKCFLIPCALFLPLKKSQQFHRTFIIYSNYNFN